jgi:hypothetical protein
VADVAVIAVGRTGRRCGEAVRAVVVVDDDDVAIAIVTADVAPVERAASDEQREHCRDSLCKETMTDRAEPHLAARLSPVNERTVSHYLDSAASASGQPGLIHKNLEALIDVGCSDR